MTSRVGRTRYRMLPSTKIALGFIGISAGAYFGYNWWAAREVDGLVFAPLTPGKVNLIGIRAGGGYKIVVQNRIAILQISDSQAEEFESPDDSARSSDDATSKQRVPMKELIGALRGDKGALSKFVAILNEVKDSDLPPVKVYWDASDIQKALDGDAGLRARLASDLGVDLKGAPLAKLRYNSLMNGIVVRVPVMVDVPRNGAVVKQEATIERPFLSALASRVEDSLRERKLRGNDMAKVRAEVVALATEMRADASKRQDVAAALRRLIDPSGAQVFANLPNRVLRRAVVVVSDSLIRDASYIEQDIQGEKYYTLRLELNDEGRQRLWQYSRRNPGGQLLLVSDGVAIAAPVIRQQISDGTVDVTQLQEESLVIQTVSLVKQMAKERKQT